jgi:hypothetical protein
VLGQMRRDLQAGRRDVGGGRRAADLVVDHAQLPRAGPTRSIVLTKLPPWAETTQDVRRMANAPPAC